MEMSRVSSRIAVSTKGSVIGGKEASSWMGRAPRATATSAVAAAICSGVTGHGISIPSPERTSRLSAMASL